VTAAAAPLIVDAVGRKCPLPVIMLAKRFPEVPVGGTVTVLADDPAARLDLPAWCRMRAQEYVGEAVERGVPAYTIRRLS
jgi:cysteine desulfurase